VEIATEITTKGEIHHKYFSQLIADEGIAETQNGVEVIVIDDMSDDSDIEVINVDTMDLKSGLDSESDSIMSPEMDLEV